MAFGCLGLSKTWLAIWHFKVTNHPTSDLFLCVFNRLSYSKAKDSKELAKIALVLKNW